VGCGLQKYSTFSEKRAKILTIFFFIFLIFYGNFDETEQGKAKVVKQSVVERG
jgi:preprotein translocase subunit SecG